MDDLMSWWKAVTDPTAAFQKPFAYQLAALRLRFLDLHPTARWDDIREDAHNRAYMVAGAQKADLLADFALAMDKAVAQGTGADTFEKDFRAIVAKHGWHGWTGEGTEAGEAWRIKTIYRTNMRTSYMAGRFAQLVDGEFKYWVYRHGGSLEPRLQHLAWDGLILPADHPFWATHYPPNGWGCSCRVFGAHSVEGAVRRGGNPAIKLPADWQAPDPRTGLPKGIGKGWGYAPGASVAKTVSLAAAKIAHLPPILGSDFGNSMENIIDRSWPTWVADILVGGKHEPALAGVLSRDVISALEAKGIAPLSSEILMKPGLISGPKATRHKTSGDALSDEDWLTIPNLLRRPDAVLLDQSSGAIVYLLPKSGSRPQLAVWLDYRMKIKRVVVTSNMVVSAYRPNSSEISRRIASGDLLLLLGSIG